MNRPENYDKCDNYKEEYLNYRDIINKCTIVFFWVVEIQLHLAIFTHIKGSDIWGYT